MKEKKLSILHIIMELVDGGELTNHIGSLTQ
jgi:hypothetical protein